MTFITKSSPPRGLYCYIFFLILVLPCILAKTDSKLQESFGHALEIEHDFQEPGVREKRMPSEDKPMEEVEIESSGERNTEAEKLRDAKSKDKKFKNKTKLATEETRKDKRMTNTGLNLIYVVPKGKQKNAASSKAKLGRGMRVTNLRTLYNGQDCSEPGLGKCISGAECRDSVCVCSEDHYGKECIQFGGSFFARVVTPELTGESDDKFVEVQQEAHRSLKPFEDLMTLKEREECDASLTAMAEAVIMYFGYRDEDNGIEMDQFRQQLKTADKVVAADKPLCDYKKFLKCVDTEGNGKPKCTHLISGVVETAAGKYKTIYKLGVGERCFHYPKIFDSKILVKCVDNAEGPCSREKPMICKCVDGYTKKGRKCEKE